MILHVGARAALGGNSTALVCCDECGVIAAENVAQGGGWGLWVLHKVRHHHCPVHIREDGGQWYAPDWTEWEWAN